MRLGFQGEGLGLLLFRSLRHPSLRLKKCLRALGWRASVSDLGFTGLWDVHRPNLQSGRGLSTYSAFFPEKATHCLISGFKRECLKTTQTNNPETSLFEASLGI